VAAGLLRSLPPLPAHGVLEPLLIRRRFLPALVGRAGADQVHVGAEVAAVFARAFAGVVGVEAEVLGRDWFRRIAQLGKDRAALIPTAAFQGVGISLSPKPLPSGQAPVLPRWLKPKTLKGSRGTSFFSAGSKK
jgi:hypothetical protein